MQTAAQYLTLRLGHQEYAIDILKVQEIRSYEEPTRMVNAPAFIKGVLNLRGVIVPVVDLRLRLKLDQAPYSALTVVIILKIQGMVVGAVVDAVSEVISLTPDQIKPAGQIETSAESSIEARFITGFASLDDRLLVLINLETLLNSAEMGRLSA